MSDILMDALGKATEKLILDEKASPFDLESIAKSILDIGVVDAPPVEQSDSEDEYCAHGYSELLAIHQMNARTSTLM